MLSLHMFYCSSSQSFLNFKFSEALDKIDDHVTATFHDGIHTQKLERIVAVILCSDLKESSGSTGCSNQVHMALIERSHVLSLANLGHLAARVTGSPLSPHEQINTFRFLSASSR